MHSEIKNANAERLKERLIPLIKKLSYREGNFTLSSGKPSTFYVDLKNVALHPEGVSLVAALAWKHLKPTQFQGVGGPTLGADPLATALSLSAFDQGVPLPAFIIRKEPKKHGTSQWIEGKDLLQPQGRLLIVEDVVTTGASSMKAVEKVRAEGFVVDTVFCILDRQEGGTETLSASGIELVSLATIAEIQKAR